MPTQNNSLYQQVIAALHQGFSQTRPAVTTPPATEQKQPPPQPTQQPVKARIVRLSDMKWTR